MLTDNIGIQFVDDKMYITGVLELCQEEVQQDGED